MAIRDDIKKQRGLNNNSFDTIIDDYVESAKADLIATGVTRAKAEDTNDKLISTAIKEYVLSFIDEEYASLHTNAYEIIKDRLRHFGEYRG